MRNQYRLIVGSIIAIAVIVLFLGIANYLISSGLAEMLAALLVLTIIVLGAIYWTISKMKKWR